MATITTRSGKGSPLTNNEVDANFTNLNNDKQEVLAEGSFADGDKTKLDGIESGATADQTAQEIATAIDADATAEATLKSALGLGTAAYTASTDYATAAQGALADSAVQPADNVSDLTNDAGYITGNQTITLSGDVSGSGTTSISVTVADDSHNHVISNVDGLQTALDGKQATGDYVVATGDSMTGNLSFGDNDKAIFGAGSDLQIYHSGTQSWIHEVGTGDLYLRGTDVRIKSDTDNDNMLTAIENGAVTLYYSNAAKLATTSTGIDVTGTVTADGLTVDNSSGHAELTVEGASSYTGYLYLQAGRTAGSGSTVGSLQFRNTDNSDEVVSQISSAANRNLDIQTNGVKRFRVEGDGDISFYEDTGTTPKFFWDASAEKLGIGTTSPSYPLTVDQASVGNSYISTIANSASVAGLLMGDTAAPANGRLAYNNNIDAMSLYTAGSERMRIDSSGNVGIGTSSPSSKLDVTGEIRTNDDIRFTSGARHKFVGGGSGNNLELGTYSSSNTVRNIGLVIDSASNVGIGTSSPASKLDVRADTAGQTLLYLKDTVYDQTLSIKVDSASKDISFTGGSSTSAFKFISGGNGERMRIDSSGNLLVGQTSASTSAAGTIITASGKSYHIATSDFALALDRKSTDGSILQFRKDQTVVGSIGSRSGVSSYYIIDPRGSGVGFTGTTTAIYPCYDGGGAADNVYDWGFSSARWDDIYATNSTINTSDEREKQDIDVLSDAEHNVAVAAKGLIRKFRWKDAVAEKGDDARIHFGVIAQDLKAAFEAEGLDAGRYAMFIHTEWWETYTDVPAVEAKDAVLDDDGNVIEEAVEAKEAYTRTDTYDTEDEAPEGAVKKDRMGVRYPELLAFIIGAL